MPIRLLVLALLFGGACASAASPKATPVSPEDIDVDALARAKDAPAPPSPTSDASGSAPPIGDAHPAQVEETPVASENIDADALARAKDVDGPKPATEETASAASAIEAADVPQPVADSEDGDAASAVEATELATGANAVEDAAADEPPGGGAPRNDQSAAAAASAQPSESPAPATGEQAAESPAAAAAKEAERRRASSCEADAKNLLDAAEKGDYATATRRFDAKMRAALPAAKFKAAWESLAQFGALTARGQSHLSKGEGYIAVSVPLIFEKANLYAQVACNNDGKIAGFYVKPLELPAS